MACVHCASASFWLVCDKQWIRADCSKFTRPSKTDTWIRYKNCKCVTSTWGGAGGYLDFSVQDTSNSRWVLYYWASGTTLTATVMFLSMFYITVEWCQQSFLSTEDYDDAMQGLRMT